MGKKTSRQNLFILTTAGDCKRLLALLATPGDCWRLLALSASSLSQLFLIKR